MEVKIIHCTPIDVALEACGQPRKTGKSSMETLEKVALVYGHESVLEHIYFNFELTSIPRFCWMEMTRHRLASYTAESSRYNLDKMVKEYGKLRQELPIPLDQVIKVREYLDFARKYYCDPLELDEGITGEFIDDYWREVLHNIEVLHARYQVLVQKHDGDKLGEMPADYLKPLLMEGKYLDASFSINLRSLRNFLKLRMDLTAHMTIRDLAWMVYNAVCEAGFKDFVEDIEAGIYKKYGEDKNG